MDCHVIEKHTYSMYKTVSRNIIGDKNDTEFCTLSQGKLHKDYSPDMIENRKSANECTVHRLHVAFYTRAPSSPVSRESVELFEF